MTFQQELQKSQKEWLNQGEERGVKKANKTAVFGMYAKKIAISDIADILNLTIEQVEEILSSDSDDTDENIKN